MIKWDKPCYKCGSHFCDLSCKEPKHLQAPQRTWVGLTDKEIDAGLLRTNYAMQTAGAWRDGVEWAQSQLKEKNT